MRPVGKSANRTFDRAEKQVHGTPFNGPLRMLPSPHEEKRSETFKRMAQHLIGDLRGFGYNPRDQTTRKREMEIRV
jgi:hypothetical protein